MSRRGFTLVETLISLVLFGIVLGTVASGLARDSNAQDVIMANVGPETKARALLHRISQELRSSSVWGEDLNHNASKTLDVGEDLNGNGVLDADWNLPDGYTTTDLSFNTRHDLTDSTGTVIASGVFSPKKRYYIDTSRSSFHTASARSGRTAGIRRESRQ